MPVWLYRLTWAAAAGGLPQLIAVLNATETGGWTRGEWAVALVAFLAAGMGAIVPILRDGRPSAVPAVLWSLLGGVVPPVSMSLAVMIQDGTVTRGEWRLVFTQAVTGLLSGMLLFFKPEPPRDPEDVKRFQ